MKMMTQRLKNFSKMKIRSKRLKDHSKELVQHSKKLKNNEELSDEEKGALANFLDEFTTVSTNENVVGADVSRIVLEVNKHSHTKTLQKVFFYPRYPCRRTIIAEPLRKGTEKETNEALKTYKEILKKSW